MGCSSSSFPSLRVGQTIEKVDGRSWGHPIISCVGRHASSYYGVHGIPCRKNQDGFAYSMAAPAAGRTLAMYAVYDGHGSSSCAMELAQDKLLDIIAPPDANTPITHDKIVKAFELVSMQIMMASSNEHTGTTATVVCLAGYMKDPTKPRFTVTTAWVGDSRCCMRTPKGKVLQLSVDHQINNPSERERIQKLSDEETKQNHGKRTTFIARRENERGDQGPWALFHAEPSAYTIDEAELSQELSRLAGAGVNDLSKLGRVCATSTLVTRALGDAHASDSMSPTPQIVQIENVKPGSRIIIGSDGLWDVFRNEAAFELIKAIKDPRKAAKHLAEKAHSRRDHHRLSQDDITVLVVDVDVPSGGDAAMEATIRNTSKRWTRMATDEVATDGWPMKGLVTPKGKLLQLLEQYSDESVSARSAGTRSGGVGGSPVASSRATFSVASTTATTTGSTATASTTVSSGSGGQPAKSIARPAEDSRPTGNALRTHFEPSPSGPPPPLPSVANPRSLNFEESKEMVPDWPDREPQQSYTSSEKVPPRPLDGSQQPAATKEQPSNTASRGNEGENATPSACLDDASTKSAKARSMDSSVRSNRSTRSTTRSTSMLGASSRLGVNAAPEKPWEKSAKAPNPPRL